QVTGVNIGSTAITATATGFASDSRTATVTLTLSFPAGTFQLPINSTRNITLTLSGPAPASGLTINLSTDNTATATVPATVLVPSGQTSIPVPVTGVAVNTTTLRASAPGITEVTATIQAVNAPAINIPDVTVGRDLELAVIGSLGAAAPAGGVIVTLTSSNPSLVLLSNS